jgi:hypothetical protein
MAVHFIECGNAMQNVLIESLNGRLRVEYSNQNWLLIFDTLAR